MITSTAPSASPATVEIATSPSELPTAINIDLTAEVRSVALLTLSQVYLQRGEYEPAKTVLYQALEHPPADPAALANLRYRLGQAYLGGEYADLDEAIWRFTEVLSVQPRSADTYSSRSLAYLERGRPGDEDLAIADLTRASDLAPHLASPYLNRAAAYIAATGVPVNYRDLGALLDRMGVTASRRDYRRQMLTFTMALPEWLTVADSQQVSQIRMPNPIV